MPISLYQRAVMFHSKGNVRKAEDCCLKSIANDAGDYESYNLLGVMAVNAEKFGLAHSYLKKALEINTKYAEGYNNLGALYNKNALLEDAKACFNQAINIQPDYAEAHYNLASVLERQKDYDLALHHFNIVMQYRPSFAGAYNGAANIFSLNGYIKEAEEYYKKVIELDPGYTSAYLSLSRMLLSTHGVASWEECIERYIKQVNFPPEQKADILTSLAIAKFILGKSSECKPLIVESGALIKGHKEYSNYAQICAYHSFLELLIKWYQNNKSVYFLKDKHEYNEVLHFIGESHSLTCANQLIQFGSVAYKCDNHFVIGCKIWHLVSEQNNVYKIAFYRELALVPKNSQLVLTIGEVDYRHDEGVFKNYVTHNIDWKSGTDTLVAEYFSKIIIPILHSGIRPVVWGIPAPHKGMVDKLQKHYQDQYIMCMRYVNEKMKSYCRDNNVGFIDNYKLTCSEEGLSRDDVKLDKIHLRPDIFVKAIEEFLSL